MTYARKHSPSEKAIVSVLPFRKLRRKMKLNRFIWISFSARFTTPKVGESIKKSCCDGNVGHILTLAAPPTS